MDKKKLETKLEALKQKLSKTDRMKLICLLLSAVVLLVPIALLLSRCSTQQPAGPGTTVSPTDHAHIFDDGVVTKAPTCGEEGLKTATCTKCGQTEQIVLAVTGEHTYGEGEVTKIPTTEQEGVLT